MHELALRLASFGRIFLIADGAIFVCAFVYLIIQMARRGQVGEDQGKVVTVRGMFGNTDPTVRGISKQKVFYSRTKFVTVESLAKGTASRQDWLFVIGFNVVMVSFVMGFLGAGLIMFPEGREFGFSVRALFFIAFPLIFVPLLLRMQYSDYKETREKLTPKSGSRCGTARPSSRNERLMRVMC